MCRRPEPQVEHRHRRDTSVRYREYGCVPGVRAIGPIRRHRNIDQTTAQQA
jgi:hypothetical protein